MNINTLTLREDPLGAFHNGESTKVVKQGRRNGLIQSVQSAMEGILEVECMLDKRYDANSEAAMAVGGGR